MATLRDQAKIFVNGKPMRITDDEPLEDSVRTVHAVMRMLAERGGEPTTHAGTRGVKHHMNLTRIVQGLTMDLGENDRKILARLISQVFRQTGAAVCLRHADPTNHKDPVWFVADTLPDSFIVVVNHVRGRSVGTSGAAPTAFDEKLFLRPGEKRLQPDEVGENLPPGEVTVKKGKKLSLTAEQREAASSRAKEIFGEHHAEHRRLHDELLEQAHEFIVTAPVPMTASELVQLYNAEYGTSWNSTTLRGIVKELVDAGRIGARKETSAERLVRGGGQPVKATAPMLLGPPEGVPERTKLPKGIKPLKSAVAYAAEKKRQRSSLEDRVYAAMDVPNTPGTGHGAPRTVHMIAVAADISDREARETLDRLVASGRVFYHPLGYYVTMNRVRQSTLDKYRDHPRQAPAEEAPTAEATEEVPVPTGSPQDRLPQDRQMAVAGIMKLVNHLAAVPEESERVAELQTENGRLREQVASLESAVAGLRQALTALR